MNAHRTDPHTARTQPPLVTTRGGRLRSLLALFVAGAVCLSRTALAQSDWEFTGPEGGIVNSLAARPDGQAIYASTSGYGVFRSTDQGQTWQLLPNAPYSALTLAIRPDHPTTLFAGGDCSGLWRSADAGDTWLATPLPALGVQALAFRPDNPDVMYAGTGGGWGGCAAGLWRSSDGGNTWEQVDLGSFLPPEAGPVGYVRAILFDASSPNRVLVATDQGLLLSTDGGMVWELVSGLGWQVMGLAAQPGSPNVIFGTPWQGGILRSENFGRTWSDWNHGLIEAMGGPVNASVMAMTILPEAPNTIYLGTYLNGVFRSTDGGGSWTAINSGLSEMQVRALLPTTDGGMVAGTWGGGAFRLPSHGSATWTEANAGLTAVAAFCVAVAPDHAGTVYAGTFYSGVIKSTDYGQTWSRVSMANGRSVLISSQITSIAVRPDRPGTVFAGSWEGGLFRSDDAGGSWAWSWGDAPWNACVMDLTICAANPDVMYAATSQFGAWRSADGGVSWTELPQPWSPGSDGSSCVAVSPVNPDTVFVGTWSGAVYRSLDGGQTWSTCAIARPPGSWWTTGRIFISPTDPDLVLVGGVGLFRSLDGGETWEDVLPWSLANTFTYAGGTIYAGFYGGGIAASEDDGLTWTPFRDGLVNGDVRQVAASANGAVLYAATGGSWPAPKMGVFKRFLKDVTAPVIRQITASPDVLWPANHKLTRVTVQVEATDERGEPVQCQIVRVTSSEPENGTGDGDTAPDITNQHGLSVDLRAERSSKGNGRTYTITVACADGSGNVAYGTVTVSVPKTKKNK